MNRPRSFRRTPSDGSPAAHLQRGRQAETLATRYLQRNGLQLLTRNYRCKVGELDLVMMDAQVLVIVEIRYRRNSDFADPLETVTVEKQRRIVRATRHLLQGRPELRRYPLRFDVLALSGPIEQAKLDWVKCAFDSQTGA